MDSRVYIYIDFRRFWNLLYFKSDESDMKTQIWSAYYEMTGMNPVHWTDFIEPTSLNRLWYEVQQDEVAGIDEYGAFLKPYNIRYIIYRPLFRKFHRPAS